MSVRTVLEGWQRSGYVQAWRRGIQGGPTAAGRSLSGWLTPNIIIPPEKLDVEHYEQPLFEPVWILTTHELSCSSCD